jgi:hypothetical protein
VSPGRLLRPAKFQISAVVPALSELGGFCMAWRRPSRTRPLATLGAAADAAAPANRVQHSIKHTSLVLEDSRDRHEVCGYRSQVGFT